jgi:hypothetical protein
MYFIAEAWTLITPTAIKNCFAKCDFLAHHVSINDEETSALTEDKMTDTVCNLFKCSLRSTRHLTILLRLVQSTSSTRCWTSS